jgi:ketosteroid isomerase-like protein
MSSQADLHDHISSLLDTYIGKFNDGNLSGAASHYDEPATGISAGSVTVFLTHQDWLGMIEATVERLKNDGWDHSDWGGPKKIILLDEKGLVLASCPCKRLRKDGSSVEEFTATYTLRKDKSHGWLIAAIHSHPFGTNL